jgi:hypothetical protein
VSPYEARTRLPGYLSLEWVILLEQKLPERGAILVLCKWGQVLLTFMACMDRAIGGGQTESCMAVPSTIQWHYA